MDYEPKLKTVKIKNLLINLDSPKVMGILNLTSDSFYKGSRVTDISQAVERASKMLEEGADFLDLGACSSRPGAKDISEKEEMERLIPALKAIRREFPKAILSADTFRANVAREAVSSGVDIINDISGGDADPNMLKTVADMDVPFVLMHMQGSPKNMQINPHYENVTKEVLAYLEEKCKLAHQAGIKDIIIDPGFGFGKTTEHNYRLLKDLNVFQCLGKPILVGMSRKSMIYKSLGTSPEHALNGTTSLNTLALIQGTDILRVHDVKEAKEVVKLVALYQKSTDK